MLNSVDTLLQDNVHANNGAHAANKPKKGSQLLKNTLLTFCLLFSLIEAYFNLFVVTNDRFKPQVNGFLGDKNESEGMKINRNFEVKLKPDLMELINPSSPKYVPTVNGSYHLENAEFCAVKKHVKLLVLILSSTKNFEQRNVVRETWGKPSNYLNYGTVKVLFVLGLTTNSIVQKQIEAEFNHSKDILQGSFIDSYQNLTYKSVICLKWLKERCRNSKYILKTDDDIVINMFRIFEIDIPRMSINQDHVHCQRRTHSKVVRRRSSEKTYVPYHQLKGLKYHRPYCHGQFVLFLNDLVPYLYHSASITPFFRIDDVFTYGIVMNNIIGLKYRLIKSSERASYQGIIIPLCWKQLLVYPKCRYLYVIVEDEKQARTVWSSIYDHYRKT